MVISRAALVASGVLATLLVGCSSPAEIGSPSGSARDAPQAQGAVRYLALGDSVTSGEGVQPDQTYPSRLAALWRDNGCNVELSNVAVTGYKSADVIGEELPAAATFEPTLVTVMVGGNDIANGVGIEEYRSNVRTILRTLTDAGATVVTVSQQFWDRTPVGQDYGTREELTAKRIEFDAALIAEGQAVGPTHVDLKRIFEEQAEKQMWLEDGLHPTAEAYDEWAAALFKAVGDPCQK